MPPRQAAALSDEALAKHVAERLKAARSRLTQMAEAATAAKNAALLAAARRIRESAPRILAANEQDMAAARQAGRTAAYLDRLRLDEARVAAIAQALEDVAALPDPVGDEIARWRRPNGLDIARVRVPLGLVAVIYESRPNVTADAAALALKAGNAVALKPGSDSLASARAIHAALMAGLEEAGLPPEAVALLDIPDRRVVGVVLRAQELVDVVVPRGGRSLVERVMAEARVPVFAHLEGICHSYVHEKADPEKARRIVLNAKMRRTGICGATETLLIDAGPAPALLPAIASDLKEAGCRLKGCPRARAICPDMEEASEEDWRTEYLDAVLSVKVVDGLDEAVSHIARYGSGHTDAIITEDAAAAELFLKRVDSAIVMWNASTQFADGGEFGMGAEIGIATGRLHARGPVGLEQLTTFKYVVRAQGAVRP
ncbi:MAG: glutamate-5-semialdehyde dehydrogenase [Alphaproteobacteria bacterium]|nr:MAG: glutamate-5-semialdehyde dehydrogenase [Alphaproteobacteria bacterium]